MEALACGTPVITFKTGGSPEAIDSTCGLVVDKSVEALAEACLKLGKKSEKISQQCCIKAKTYDEKKCFGGYLDLYESI